MTHLVSPTGVRILGTVETIPGTCAFMDPDSITRGADGRFLFAYTGYTEVDWDNQETVTSEGQRLFYDEDGISWPENRLILKEDDDGEAD